MQIQIEQSKFWSNCIQIIIVSIAYFLFGKLAFSISVSNGIVTNVPFFAEGIGLSAIILFGNLSALGIFIGQLVLAISSGIDVNASICISAINAVLAILGRFLFYRFKLSPNLKSIRDVIFLTTLILFIIQPLSAILGNYTLLFFNIINNQVFWGSLITWWLGNSIGQLILVPFVLFLFSKKYKPRIFLYQDFPLAIATFLFTFMLFKLTSYISESYTFSTLLFLFPTTLLFSTQRKPETVVLSLLFMTVAAFLAISLNLINLPRNNPIETFMQLDLLILSLQISGLMLTVLISEWKNTKLALMESEKRLKELNATKDKFFSIISHDLRSPLITILGVSEALSSNIDELEKEQIKEFAYGIYERTEITFSLLENLLEWARSQQDKIQILKETLNLSSTINECSNIFENQAAAKELKITNTIPEQISIFADKEMLKTIMRNLISNAIKYTPKKGEITISAIAGNQQVEIIISDNGIGINEKVKQSLFKIEETRSLIGTDGERGTGLGLILCKEFIEKLGGKIWVESKEGKGSEFKFILPQ